MNNENLTARVFETVETGAHMVALPDGRTLTYRTSHEALFGLIAWGTARGLTIKSMSPEDGGFTLVTFVPIPRE